MIADIKRFNDVILCGPAAIKENQNVSWKVRNTRPFNAQYKYNYFTRMKYILVPEI